MNPIPHETDPANPDYWVDEGAQTYDPDGEGPLEPEVIVREAGANPALQHYQAPVVSGNVTFAVYMYVTWMDTEDDGLGIDDADGETHDAKRVVVVVTWTDPVTGNMESSQMSSVISEGSLPYEDDGTGGTGAGDNQAPTVPCPSSTNTDQSYSFASTATDADGSIVNTAWEIEGFGTASGYSYTGSGTTYAATLEEEGPYRVITTVTDDDGGTADNSLPGLPGTASTTSNNQSGNGGPAGTVVISAGSTYVNSLQVTLTLSCPTCDFVNDKMQFSNDGSTWTSKVLYNTTSLYTLPNTQGSQTVYARFWAGGQYGAWATDTIILDTIAPNAPTSLTKFSSQNQGSNKNVTFQWTLPNPVSSDSAGYRIYYRLTTSTGAFTSATCSPVTTNRCIVSDVFKKNDSYQTYLVYYDFAGNESAPSNTITV